MLLAPPGEPTQQPDRRVFGGDQLVDEPQVRGTAEQGGHAVQGFARAEDHHGRRLRGEAAGGTQASGFDQTAGDQGDLVRQPAER